MTGRPKLALFSQRIEQLGGDDWFFDQVAADTTMGAIAEQVGCSRPQLYAWMDDGEGRRERYKAAQKIAAEGCAESAHQIPEDLVGRPIEPVHVQLAKLRVDTKMKRAAQLDPETYGEKQAGISLNLNIGQLHLDALRAKGSMTLATQTSAPAQILEAHVVEEGE